MQGHSFSGADYDADAFRAFNPFKTDACGAIEHIHTDSLMRDLSQFLELGSCFFGEVQTADVDRAPLKDAGAHAVEACRGILLEDAGNMQGEEHSSDGARGETEAACNLSDA